jgi:hypothetical protein
VCVESFPGSLERAHGDPVMASLSMLVCWLMAHGWPMSFGPRWQKRVFHPPVIPTPWFNFDARNGVRQ